MPKRKSSAHGAPSAEIGTRRSARQDQMAAGLLAGSPLPLPPPSLPPWDELASVVPRGRYRRDLQDLLAPFDAELAALDRHTAHQKAGILAAKAEIEQKAEDLNKAATAQKTMIGEMETRRHRFQLQLPYEKDDALLRQRWEADQAALRLKWRADQAALQRTWQAEEVAIRNSTKKDVATLYRMMEAQNEKLDDFARAKLSAIKKDLASVPARETRQHSPSPSSAC